MQQDHTLLTAGIIAVINNIMQKLLLIISNFNLFYNDLFQTNR